MANRISLAAIVIIFTGILVACNPAPELTPTPDPTATRPPAAPRNENVDALNSAQAALKDVGFGFASLLTLDETTIPVQQRYAEDYARLNYPQQPANPVEWSTVDSFVSAYSTRYVLKQMPQVSRVAFGVMGIPASVGDSAEKIEHIAAWITFADRSRAVVDLTPLSTNFAARHTPDNMIIDDVQIESMFADRREGVDLDSWRPMLIDEAGGDLYYLLAKIEVDYNQYRFALRMHPVKPADPMEPMQLRPGLLATVLVDRAEFEPFQEMIAKGGKEIFIEQPDLLQITGNANGAVSTLLIDHSDLMWHLITKLQHQAPDPSAPTPTPVPTATPSPTPSPTPTPTRQRMPLETS